MHQIPGVATFLHKASKKEWSYCFQLQDPQVTFLIDPCMTPSGWGERAGKLSVSLHRSQIHRKIFTIGKKDAVIVHSHWNGV